MRALRCLTVVGACLVVSAGAVHGQPAQLGIEFRIDGRCTVSAKGDGFHSDLTYMPQATEWPRSEFRCAVPPIPADRAIQLLVSLPLGSKPGGGESPKLSWAEREGLWVGTATVDTVPDIVIVHTGGEGLAGFDWTQPLLLSTIGALVLLLLLVVRRTRFQRRVPTTDVHTSPEAP